MIDNPALENILLTATDFSTVCEIYESDAVPTDDGFDPAEAIGAFAAIDGIVFRGRTYSALVEKFGSAKRTITTETNSTSVTFCNLANVAANFEFAHGFEGLILVIRLISRSMSVELSESQLLFVGRCDKPKSGNRKSFTVSAKAIVGSIDIQIPRRTFTEEDREGRVPTDPEFEGFKFLPQYGTTHYSVREKRGGILGFFGFKKTVKKTLPYSSHSDLDADKPVPEVWGRSQLIGVHIAYIDVGTTLKIRTAFCEGPISGFSNIRSTNALLPLNAGSIVQFTGKVGTANGPDDPSFVGPGYYSRTAYIRSTVTNSAVDVIDPAPDIAAVIHGRLMQTPDEDGNWETNSPVVSDNAAAHTYFAFTSPFYFNLGTEWIDQPSFTECYNFNKENIFNIGLSDFVFIDVG